MEKPFEIPPQDGEGAPRDERGQDELREELEAYREKIRQLTRLADIGQLSAGILHEIKNPVSFVNNFSKFSLGLVGEVLEIVDKQGELNEDDLAEQRGLLEAIRTNLRKIHENGTRIDRIIRGMLGQLRGEKAAFEVVNLPRLLDEYSKLAYHSARNEDMNFNVSFRYGFDPSLEEIGLVESEFGRVILNLVSNACYAVNERRKSDEKGFDPIIEIRTKKRGDYAEIQVEDNGIGIPEEMIPNLFQPFFTTKPAGKGTGLGLSLTHASIVETHKGRIEATSVPKVKTTFTITLPLTKQV